MKRAILLASILLLALLSVTPAFAGGSCGDSVYRVNNPNHSQVLGGRFHRGERGHAVAARHSRAIVKDKDRSDMELEDGDIMLPDGSR